MSEHPESRRRSFLLGAIYGFWGLIAAALGLPAAAYLLLPPRTRKEAEWVEAGELRRLETGVPEQWVFRRNRVDGWKVTSEKASAWVLKLSPDKIIAFAPQCTHLGCAYRWEEQKQQFVCPCHSSAFSKEGQVLSGPAPRPLDRFQVRIQGDKVTLGPLEKRVEPSA